MASGATSLVTSKLRPGTLVTDTRYVDNFLLDKSLLVRAVGVGYLPCCSALSVHYPIPIGPKKGGLADLLSSST